MKTSSRTSQTHPLQIAEVQAGEGTGRIGITFCPGKKDGRAMTGTWDRNLDIDLDRVAESGAVAVVSLIQDHEMNNLQVTELGARVRERHMTWFHLPIRDVSVPDRAWEAQWTKASEQLRGMLAAGSFRRRSGGTPRPGLVPRARWGQARWGTATWGKATPSAGTAPTAVRSGGSEGDADD